MIRLKYPPEEGIPERTRTGTISIVSRCTEAVVSSFPPRPAFGPPNEEQEMPTYVDAAPGCVPAPPPCARWNKIIWTPAKGPLDLVPLVEVYEGYWTHWVGQGKEGRTVACMGPRKCLNCKEYALPQIWTGYLLACDPETKKTGIVVVTPSAADGLKPFIANGLRGKQFRFQRNLSFKGNPIEATFVRDRVTEPWPDPMPIFPILCKAWRLSEAVAYDTLRGMGNQYPGQWDKINEQNRRQF